MIREMRLEDYDQVYALWMSVKGFAMRSVDDSREGVERFLARNPHISVVAEEEGQIVGAILCGHDGRLSVSCMCIRQVAQTRDRYGDGGICHGSAET